LPHLHLRWQRTVLPSLAKTIEAWHGAHAPKVQVIVATHSPLILASMELIFDAKADLAAPLQHGEPKSSPRTPG
jgi:predicted ATPase